MLTVGSLFSGAGLCDLGFHRAGFEHQWFCETDGYCRAVLARHWPGVHIYKDIRELDTGLLPPADVLVGGFPCQDVSSVGRRAGITKTTRSGLWYEYRRIIEGMRPRYAVIENVPGLRSKGLDIVLEDLSACGYDAEWQSLAAAAFGAPHMRERVFIVAYPDSDRHYGVRRLLFEERGDLGGFHKPGRMAVWGGVQVDRTSRQAIRQAYCGPSICRVDDGSSPGLDGSVRGEPGVISRDCNKVWQRRLKALGNGICPQQAFYVACAILRAEGLPLPKNNL